MPALLLSRAGDLIIRRGAPGTRRFGCPAKSEKRSVFGV